MNLAKTLGLAGLGLAATLAFAAQAQAATIVASRGPSASKFPVGRKLASDAKITLVDGDMVTLLDERGTRVLAKPGTFTVGQSSSDSRQSVFVALVQDRATVRVRTGSVRNGPNGEPPRSPNLWYVDVSRPGTYCLSDPAHLRLWRPAMGEAATLTIKGPKGSGQVIFGKDDMVAPWDTSVVPVVAGADYALFGNGEAMGKFSFKLIDAVPQDMEATAALLIDKGCSEQLDLLTSTLRLPEG